MAGLFAPQGESALFQCLQHVAVAHPGLHHRDASIGHGQFESQIGHHRDHHGVVRESATFMQIHGTHGHDLIPVHHLPIAVHGQTTIGITIKGQPHVGPVGNDSSLQQLWICGPAVVVDVEPVGLVVQHHHLCSKGPDHIGCHLRSGAVGAIEHHREPRQRAPLKRGDHGLGVIAPGLLTIGDDPHRGTDGR